MRTRYWLIFTPFDYLALEKAFAKDINAKDLKCAQKHAVSILHGPYSIRIEDNSGIVLCTKQFYNDKGAYAWTDWELVK